MRSSLPLPGRSPLADAVRVLGTKTGVGRAAGLTARHIDYLLTEGKAVTKAKAAKGIEDATRAAGNAILAVHLLGLEDYTGPQNGPPPKRKARRGPAPMPPNLRLVQNGTASARPDVEARLRHPRRRRGIRTGQHTWPTALALAG